MGGGGDVEPEGGGGERGGEGKVAAACWAAVPVARAVRARRRSLWLFGIVVQPA